MLDVFQILMFVMEPNTVQTTQMKSTANAVKTNSSVVTADALEKTINVMLTLIVLMHQMRWVVLNPTALIILFSLTPKPNSSIVPTLLLVFILTGSVMDRTTVGIIQMNRTVLTKKEILRHRVHQTPSSVQEERVFLLLGDVIERMTATMQEMEVRLLPTNSTVIMDVHQISSSVITQTAFL
jgi:hypothetical protein